MLVQAVKMLVEAVQVLGFVSSSILPTIVLFITVQQCNLDMYRNIMYHLSVNKHYERLTMFYWIPLLRNHLLIRNKFFGILIDDYILQ